MKGIDEQKVCSNCGAALASNAPRGLCPACLMKVALATGTGAGEEKPGFTPPTVEELAQKFPRLEIIELVGRGGMGAVYKARQKELDRIVALKILPPRIGDETAFAERFTYEAKALARLNHPGIVTLYEFGKAEGSYFFLMEFVDGVTLRKLLAKGRISPREALAIIPQICDALQFAHDQGIVHRDIKPDNILLDRRGRVKVADFGLAKLVGGEGEIAGNTETSTVANLTQAGKVMGTLQYMAPEQVRAPGEVDHRADIYALGVVLYQMLTGEMPGKPLQPPSRKFQMDVRLDEVVLRALENEPERRYQKAGELKTQVETIAETTAEKSSAPPSRPPPEGIAPVRAERVCIRVWPTSGAIATTIFFALGLLCAVSGIGGAALPVAAVGGVIALTLSVWTFDKCRQEISAGRVVYAHRLLQVLATLAWLTTIPVLGLGLFFLEGATSSDAPSLPPEDLLMVLFPWLGSILMPVSSFLLLRAVRMTRAASLKDQTSLESPSRRRNFWLVVSGLALPTGLFGIGMLISQMWEEGTDMTSVAMAMGISAIAIGLTLMVWQLLGALKQSRLDDAKPRLRRVVVIGAAILLFASLAAVGFFFGVRQSRNDDLRQARQEAMVRAKREIERVVVTSDKAVVTQQEFNGEGMMVMFGSVTNRWEPQHLDSLLSVTLEQRGIGRGANWVIKSAHGNIGYHVESPAGSLKGKILFRPGTPASEADDAYVIGAFQSDKGETFPIAVRLGRAGSNNTNKSGLSDSFKK